MAAPADKGTMRYVVLMFGVIICFSLGFFFGPWGVLVTPFVGAFLGIVVTER